MITSNTPESADFLKCFISITMTVAIIRSGHTHDLIQLQLRTWNVYSSDGTVDFLQPVLDKYCVEI